MAEKLKGFKVRNVEWQPSGRGVVIWMESVSIYIEPHEDGFRWLSSFDGGDNLYLTKKTIQQVAEELFDRIHKRVEKAYKAFENAVAEEN